MKWTEEDRREAEAQGWGLGLNIRGPARTGYGYQRWPTREDCQQWIIAQAEAGDPLCTKAVALWTAERLRV